MSNYSSIGLAGTTDSQASESPESRRWIIIELFSQLSQLNRLSIIPVNEQQSQRETGPGPQRHPARFQVTARPGQRKERQG